MAGSNKYSGCMHNRVDSSASKGTNNAVAAVFEQISVNKAARIVTIIAMAYSGKSPTSDSRPAANQDEKPLKNLKYYSIYVGGL